MDITKLKDSFSSILAAGLGSAGRHRRKSATGFSTIENFPSNKKLPDPFLRITGGRVTNQIEWRERREEIKDLLTCYEYGRMPPPPGNVTADDVRSFETCDGLALEKRVRICMGPGHRLGLDLKIVSPRGNGPFPVIVINRRKSPRSHTLTEHLEASIRRGYLVAEYSVTSLQADETVKAGPAKLVYPGYDWGTIAIWAWGGMRVIDHLLTRPEVDGSRLIVTGNSRHGKAALLTGALDERVTLTVPNASGGGGFQCWRFPIWEDDPPGARRHESIGVMIKWRDYWFSPRLAPFAASMDRLPFDQHFLPALIAPRALCAVESLDDRCATPICVQRTYQAALEVYQWLEAGNKLGVYFRRTGGHGQGRDDWDVLLDFADQIFTGRLSENSRRFDWLPYPEARPGFSWQAPAKPAQTPAPGTGWKAS